MSLYNKPDTYFVGAIRKTDYSEISEAYRKSWYQKNWDRIFILDSGYGALALAVVIHPNDSLCV